MLNFPVPYPEELIYSTVARAGVHFGITSPKRLLDEAFGNRMIVATVDLPSHLETLSKHYPQSLGLTPEQLAYKHTLLPLYAPFVPEARRQKCLQWMARASKGAAHLSLGITTSRVKPRRHFRLCPSCLNEQLARYGEYYWERLWQVAGCDACLKHATLLKTQHRLRNYHRHEFIALTPEKAIDPQHSLPPPVDKRIELRVFELLNLPSSPSPSLEQWGLFYKHFAHDTGITRGDKVIYDLLKQKILTCWPERLLQRIGILIDDSQSSWLRLIMRKPRKAFSYMEHIIVLEALLGPDWHILEVMNQVRKQKQRKAPAASLHTPRVSSAKLTRMRETWMVILKTHGTRQGRLLGADSIYTWLYRHDKKWLLEINARYRKSTRSDGKRIDWQARDLEILERLEHVKRSHGDKHTDPRRSANWYLAQAACRHLSRKMDKLPLSAAFLKKYSEDVASYQIRRINRVLQDKESSAGSLLYWELMRLSGLNEQRMTKRTREFLRQSGWSA
ncbi:TnsD family Tn7-like transposition protein [Pseudodesulfovibrio pelocollis]|uniref:TnsD family Tn7-like transposition protein n=1 Tax=Pseudodesulfovibrio pelocollis TaxID=3051432 RepID=UPI00255B3A72|nr:TnsD family Tn7-like transposition protein [Pseudodesulfovibrio sp. SB368]